MKLPTTCHHGNHSAHCMICSASSAPILLAVTPRGEPYGLGDVSPGQELALDPLSGRVLYAGGERELPADLLLRLWRQRTLRATTVEDAIRFVEWCYAQGRANPGLFDHFARFARAKQRHGHDAIERVHRADHTLQRACN